MGAGVMGKTNRPLPREGKKPLQRCQRRGRLGVLVPTRAPRFAAVNCPGSLLQSLSPVQKQDVPGCGTWQLVALTNADEF